MSLLGKLVFGCYQVLECTFFKEEFNYSNPTPTLTGEAEGFKEEGFEEHP